MMKCNQERVFICNKCDTSVSWLAPIEGAGSIPNALVPNSPVYPQHGMKKCQIRLFRLNLSKRKVVDNHDCKKIFIPKNTLHENSGILTTKVDSSISKDTSKTREEVPVKRNTKPLDITIGKFEKIQNDKRKYKCLTCQAEFVQKAHFNTHYLVLHERRKSKPVPCLHCDKIFGTKQYMKEHVRNVHQNIFLECSEKDCDKKFKTTGCLSRHRRKFHKIRIRKKTACQL